MKAHFQRGSLLVCFLFSSLFAGAAMAQEKDWRPVTPEELASKKGSVDPDAEAEAIFWEVRIDDSGEDDLVFRHYVRVKVYNERGRDKYSKFDVPFAKGRVQIKDLAARVTKPDGTSVEINKDDVFEREIIKANGIKVKAKSFAVPNIEAGVIIEYRYKEVYIGAGAQGLRIQFQRDIPVQKLSYYYKPYSNHQPKYQSYNFTDTKFVKDSGGYWLASRTDIPALKEEPWMPPDDTVRPWMLITGFSIGVVSESAFSIEYTVKDPSSPPKYWGGVGAERSPLTNLMNKKSGDIKKAAEEITAGATTPDEKLKKLYEYCQTQIANTSFDPSITNEQRAKLPHVNSISDVLKRRSASSQYIDMLFGSLANALEYETRIAYSGDRSKMFFTPDMTNEHFIHPAAIAVKVDNEWKYFNPGVRFLPYGMLLWYEEDSWAILVGEKSYDWKQTPLTPFGTSVTKRNAKFTLLDEGTLEGTVEMELNGQTGLMYRMDNYTETPAKLEENLKQEITSRISAAEVSAVSIENLTDSSKPLIQKYKIRIPNYAQKTGKRLFLQPGFFEYGSNPIFSSSARKYDLFFRYPWSQEDHVEITYPKNFDLDNADAPGATADPAKIGSLDIEVKVSRSLNLLSYDRRFHFGGGGHVLFGAAMYQPLKSLFDQFHKADSHTITLKQQ